MSPELLRLLHEHEQDTAELHDWWASESAEGKSEVWDAIQADQPDEASEVMSRLAQWVFTEMMLQEKIPHRSK